MRDFKIDLVYLWVDGSDPEWIAKKSTYDGSLSGANKEVASACRYFDNDELMYSLRSVEIYAPWINHIYIVSDGQTPKWLDVNNPKISIIDHSQIMPKEALPTFNSTAIEWNIVKIPGLSEHYLYANDDMMFCKPTSPDMFFDSSGKPIVRIKRRSLLYYRFKKGSNYALRVYRSIQLIMQDFGKLYQSAPHHCIDAYQKSTVEQCIEHYQHLVDRSINNRFRVDDDIQRSIVLLYSLAVGKGVLRWVNRFNQYSCLWDKIRAFLIFQSRPDSLHVHISSKSYARRIARRDPVLICLNDSHRSTNADRVRAREYFESRYPHSSSFERKR